MLSLAEIRGLHFPMFNVKDLTLETSISQYVIPGVERILQNSPDLKKLTLHTRHYIAIPVYTEHKNSFIYLDHTKTVIEFDYSFFFFFFLLYRMISFINTWFCKA